VRSYIKIKIKTIHIKKGCNVKVNDEMWSHSCCCLSKPPQRKTPRLVIVLLTIRESKGGKNCNSLCNICSHFMSTNQCWENTLEVSVNTSQLLCLYKSRPIRATSGTESVCIPPPHSMEVKDLSMWRSAHTLARDHLDSLDVIFNSAWKVLCCISSCNSKACCHTVFLSWESLSSFLLGAIWGHW